MPGTNYRTWQQYHVGHLTLTVQLDAIVEDRNLERHRELAGVTRQLISTMDSQRVPTTWAVSDPAHSAATSLILKSDVEHELAILGDANWIGPTAGRTRFARELTRRLSQARSAGLHVTSLVPRVASIESQIDLVVKQGVTAVAGFESATATREIHSPRALHYGVWEFPVSGNLPFTGRWTTASKWSMWRRIRRTASEAGSYHLHIDAVEIAASGHGGEWTVAWLARRIAGLRDRGMLRVETLQSAATRLSDVPVRVPQRSILRAAG
jgi:hypothetical protein